MEQNACLMITSDEDDGKSYITYIPLHIKEELFEFILKNGACTNKKVSIFELGETQDEYWKDMWQTIEEAKE